MGSVDTFVGCNPHRLQGYLFGCHLGVPQESSRSTLCMDPTTPYANRICNFQYVARTVQLNNQILIDDDHGGLQIPQIFSSSPLLGIHYAATECLVWVRCDEILKSLHQCKGIGQAACKSAIHGIVEFPDLFSIVLDSGVAIGHLSISNNDCLVVTFKCQNGSVPPCCITKPPQRPESFQHNDIGSLISKMFPDIELADGTLPLLGQPSLYALRVKIVEAKQICLELAVSDVLHADTAVDNLASVVLGLWQQVKLRMVKTFLLVLLLVVGSHSENSSADVVAMMLLLIGKNSVASWLLLWLVLWDTGSTEAKKVRQLIHGRIHERQGWDRIRSHLLGHVRLSFGRLPPPSLLLSCSRGLFSSPVLPHIRNLVARTHNSRKIQLTCRTPNLIEVANEADADL